MEAPRLALTLEVAPSWDEINTVREGVLRLMSTIARDQAAPISMVVSELLENAVKYGVQGRASSLGLFIDQKRVSVSVTNHVATDSPKPAELVAHVAWLREFQDPVAAFTAALGSAVKNRSPAESGIGLARVLCEGGCKLECSVSEPGVVVVLASAERSPR